MSDSPGKIVERSSEGSLTRHLMRAAVILGMVAVLVGAGHLIAWLGGCLAQRGLTTITMKANAALCLTLMGVALMLLVPAQVGWARRWAARVCAASALCVGLLTLAENLSGWDFGIDQLLAIETPGALAVAGPNRMGTPASLSFTLTGLALLILSRRDHRGVRAAQALALAVCLIGLLATIGFLYRAEQFYDIARYTGIAWPTAVMLLLMGLGLLCARPAQGLMAQVTANDPGGVSIRRLLPAFVILPLLLGWLRLAGERAGIFDAALGTGMMMLLFIIIFSALTYHTSRGASRSAQTLRESEERFRVAQELSLDAFTILTAVRDGSSRIVDFRWQYVNPAAGRILRHAPAELVGRRLLEVLPDSQTNSDLFAHYVRVVETGRPHDYELAYESEGGRGWFRNMAVKLGDGIAVYFADITARKRTEEALRASEERFRRYFELGLVGMAITSPTKGMIEVNDAFCQIFGYERDELLRKTWAELTHPDDLAADVTQFDRVMAGQIDGYTMDKRFLRKDGQVIDASISVTVVRGTDGSVDYSMGLLLDITERKRAQEALVVAHHRITSILETMSDCFVTFDRDWRYTYVNAAAAQAFHVTPQQLLGKTLWEAWPAAYDLPLGASFRRSLAENVSIQFEQFYPEPLNRWFECRCHPTPEGLATFFSDITERKGAEEELEQSRARLGWVLETTGVGTWLNELPLGRLNWDEQTRHLFFMPPAVEPTIDLFWSRIHPEDREPTRLAVEQAIRDHALYDIEHRVVNPDTGEIQWIRSAGRATYAPDGTPVRFDGINYDITTRRRAEEALRELNATLESKVAQRTAELQRRAGQLQKLALELSQAEERERRRVAVILHEDLQQQIAGARFHLNRLHGRANDDRQRAQVDRVDEMLKAAIEKSRNLSRDLSPTVLHMNDLGEALRWLVSRVQTQHGLTVHLDVKGKMVLPSEAMATFLFRAAQELLCNVARHAGVNEAVIRVRRLGRYVGLSVFDQGRGFDPQELKKTSGFGLLSLRERTELLGGHMKIESAIGRRSRFRIVVPDGQKTEDGTQGIAGAGPRAHAIPSVSGDHAGKEGGHAGPLLRVLVVDDHEMVRQGLASLLQEAPDLVVVGQAASGHEAINMAMESRPHVVIMDVSMPLMAGNEAARQIKTHLPATRVIALSMYDEADKIEMMYQAGAESYVLKTAPAEELLAAIRGRRDRVQEETSPSVKPS